MKKFSLLFALICASLMTMAQDEIVKKDGSTIKSKVMEITGTEIKYKKWSNQDGPLYSISRSEVSTINYQNGEVERFSDKPTIASSTSNTPTYVRGQLSYDFKSNQLYLNGNYLSREDSKRLLGNDAYEDVVRSMNTVQVGKVFSSIFYITWLPGIVCTGIGYGIHSDVLATIGWACLGVSIPSATAGLIINTSGRRRINGLLTEYNRNNPYAVTFNLLPSLMSAENMGQNNIGLGLTFSMNF